MTCNQEKCKKCACKEEKKCQICNKPKKDCENWNAYYGCCEECLK